MDTKFLLGSLVFGLIAVGIFIATLTQPGLPTRISLMATGFLCGALLGLAMRPKGSPKAARELPLSSGD
ncbi:hypothetical protein BH23PLA1_BH23PLA1_15890 [soil metagenome]